ncbi:MAG: 30S ribosomal protein S20 [Desulfovibrionaceae bacterium]
MANHASAVKRHRQSLKRNEHNRAARTRVKNVVKDVRTAVESKDKDAAVQALRAATSVLDKAAGKNVLHKRNAARRIARLQKAVNAL